MVASKLVAARALAALKLMFVGDSLSMPVHWFYDVRDILRTFPPAGIVGFEAAPQYHPSSIMNLHSTFQGGRTSAAMGLSGSRTNSPREIVGDVILKGRRHLWGKPNQHYHAGMKAGENTLNLQCARVLIRTITKMNGTYDTTAALDEYIQYMTADPPQYRDIYAESYHRGFFANLEQGKPRNECGAFTHDTPSVGGLVSIGPLAIALLLKTASSIIGADPNQLLINEAQIAEVQGMCRKHLYLTHPDRDLAKVSDSYVALVAELLFRDESSDGAATIRKFTANLIGERSLINLLKREDREVIGGVYSPACYISGSWPSVIYLATKYSDEPLQGLLSNANVGGDNCHRGAVLGLLLGLVSDQTSCNDDALLMFNKLVEAKEIEIEFQQLIDATLGTTSSVAQTACI